MSPSLPSDTQNVAQALAQPALKWAGGKRRLLAQYESHFPTEFGNYFEPFVGGGAVFFWLWNRGLLDGKTIQLSDLNGDLVNFYLALRDQSEALFTRMKFHKLRHSEEHYYKVRAQNKNRLKDVNRAARLLYLNRTCFNGLYRENAKGQFNVPMGRYKNPRIFDPEGLKAASGALQNANVSTRSYDAVDQLAKSGDLVYFDPPYAPLNSTANFTAYTKDNFRLEDQERLADLFRRLSARGVQVRLSNSDSPLVRELYRDFDQVQVMAPRAINSKATSRQKISELLITN